MSATVSSACGAARDSTVPGEMCPPGGMCPPDPEENLLENPAKGLSPCPGETFGWRQVESNMLREKVVMVVV